MGSLLRLNSARNSRRSEIIRHFWPGMGPVRSGMGPAWFGAIQCGPLRLIVTPCNGKCDAMCGMTLIRRLIHDFL